MSDLPTASVAGLPKAAAGSYAPPKPTLPWERQPGEPARAYRGFATYRDLGPERTIADVATELHLDHQTVRQWQNKWRWNERTAAWDQEMDRRTTQAQLKGVEKMNERHINLAMSMQSKIAERLRDFDADKLNNRDLERWLDRTVRVERIARGLDDGMKQGGLVVNVSQNAAASAAVQNNSATIVGTVAEFLAANPHRLGEANALIADLKAITESQHEQTVDVSGMPPLRDVPGESD